MSTFQEGLKVFEKTDSHLEMTFLWTHTYPLFKIWRAVIT